jgi:hypothetical protein
MDAISPNEHAIAIVQMTEMSRLKNRQGAPPVVNAVAMTVDSASQVAIKQRHRLPSDHIE